MSDNVGTLASIAYLEGRGADAEKLFRSRLAIDERVLGKDHPDVAITLNNIARVLVERRAYSSARPLLERAVAITRQQRGDAYEDLAFMLGSLAIVRRVDGRAGEAEALLREAIAIGREQEHRSLAPNMVELASLLCTRRQFAEGTALLARAARSWMRTIPTMPGGPPGCTSQRRNVCSTRDAQTRPALSQAMVLRVLRSGGPRGATTGTGRTGCHGPCGAAQRVEPSSAGEIRPRELRRESSYGHENTARRDRWRL